MSLVATIVVLDTSQSMVKLRVGGKTRFELATSTLTKRVDQFVGDNIHFCLKQFSSDQSVRTLLALGQYSREEIVEAINRAQITNGGTPLAKAILESVTDLRKGQYSRSSVICFTDGENNAPPPPTMEDAIRAAKSIGVRVDADPTILIVGFGYFGQGIVEKYAGALREIGGLFLTVPDRQSSQEIVDNANYALDVASGAVGASTAAVIAGLQTQIRSLEERLQRTESIRPRGLLVTAIASLLATIFVGWMVVQLTERTAEKMTAVNGKLDSFAADLDKMWDLRGR
jgi:hypothetical protein